MVVVLRIFPWKQVHGLPRAQVMQRRYKTRNIFRMIHVTQGYETNVVSNWSFRLFLYKNNSILSAEHFRSLLKRVLIKKKKCRYFWFWEFVRLVLDFNRCRALPAETRSTIYRQRQVIPIIIKAILCQLNNDLSEIWNGWSKCLTFVWRWGLLDMILLQMLASVWLFGKIIIRIYRRWRSKKKWLKLHLISYKNLSAIKSQSNLMNIFGLMAVRRIPCPGSLVPGPAKQK